MNILFNTIYFKETPRNAQILNCIEIGKRLSKNDKYKFYIFNTSNVLLEGLESIHIKSGLIGKIQQLFYLLFGQQKIIVYYYNGIVDRVFTKLKKLFNKLLIITLEIDFPSDEIIELEKNYLEMRKRNIHGIIKADFIISISEHVSETYKKYLSNKKVFLAHVGFNNSFASKECGKNDFITFVGTIQERKNPLFILKLSELFPNEKFVFIGKGYGKISLDFKNMLDQKKTKNLVWYFDLSPEEISFYLQRSKIFIFPSIFEGTPKVLYEAAACGVPCITMAKVDSPVVIDNVTGLISSSEENFTENLKYLLANDEMREKFSKNIENISRLYSWDNIINEWETVFMSIDKLDVKVK